MAETEVFKCRGIVKGAAGGAVKGEAIISTDAMCFYLCDPETGEVIERNHSLQGKSIAGKILVLKSGKGSSVGTGGWFLSMPGQGHARASAFTFQALETTKD